MRNPLPPVPGGPPRLLTPTEAAALAPSAPHLHDRYAIHVGLHPFPTHLAAWAPRACLRSPAAVRYLQSFPRPVPPTTPPAEDDLFPYTNPANIYLYHFLPGRRPRLPHPGLPAEAHAAPLDWAARLSNYWATVHPPGQVRRSGRPPIPAEQRRRVCSHCHTPRPLSDFSTPTGRRCDYCTPQHVRWARIHR